MPSFELAQDYLRLAGQKLGPYVVLEIASMGGVALVYRGEHATLHNQVAIKVLTPEAVPESARATLEQLFLREAQILSQLRCEDILRAHDVGRARCPSDGKERPYMVVDWLHGHTFDQEIEARKEDGQPPFQLTEVLTLLEPIARGLEVAHQNGIIHRDVNPRNFLLEERSDGSVHAKLIDFGFAKAIASTLTVQNVTGTLYAGSPDYSAPEHYDRERYGELSEMTDVYTLALSLVEALTLQPPLEGVTPEALAFCTANPNERPTPRQRGAQVSDAVEALFARALAVDQSERPTSVLEWWHELQATSERSERAASAASERSEWRGRRDGGSAHDEASRRPGGTEGRTQTASAPASAPVVATSATQRAGSVALPPRPSVPRPSVPRPSSHASRREPVAPVVPVAPPPPAPEPPRESLTSAVELDEDAVLEADDEPVPSPMLAQPSAGYVPPPPEPFVPDSPAPPPEPVAAPNYVPPPEPVAAPNYVPPSEPVAAPNYVPPPEPVAAPSAAPPTPEPVAPPPSQSAPRLELSEQPLDDDDDEPVEVRRPRPWARRIGFALTGLIFVGGATAGVARFVPWPLTCPAGRADCNHRALDGCETDLRSSFANCGGCGHVCTTKNASATCSAGVCKVVACSQPGHKDCNGNAADGCEVDVQTDPKNCGACGKVCSSAGAEQVACKSGACSVVCKKDFGDCDGKAADGCETNLSTSAAHCGRCDRACHGTSCQDGMCAPKVVETVASAEHLATASGRFYFWDAKSKQIDSLNAGGKPTPVVKDVSDLFDLAVSPDVIAWSTSKPARVWAAETNGKARRALTGVLPRASHVVLDATRGFVAWTERVRSKKRVARTLPNAVAVGAFDVDLLSHPPRAVDCDGPVTAFAGDADHVVCCAGGGLITALACKSGQCASHRYKMPCPRSLTLDASWLFFPEGARLIALSRQGGHIRQLAKLRGGVHDLAFDADYVYFLAGSREVDVWRVKRPAQGAAASEPELLARRQLDAAWLAVDDAGIYWTRRAKGGTEIVEVPK